MRRQDFGEVSVYTATHSFDGARQVRLPKSEHRPMISDGRFGELYEGDSAGARKLAADLLAAADAYDALAEKLGHRPSAD